MTDMLIAFAILFMIFVGVAAVILAILVQVYVSGSRYLLGSRRVRRRLGL